MTADLVAPAPARATIPVPGLDLAATHAALREEIEEAVLRVLRSGHYILGPEVEAFEAEFAAYTGARHAIGVANGLDALRLAFALAGLLAVGALFLSGRIPDVPPGAAVQAPDKQPVADG